MRREITTVAVAIARRNLHAAFTNPALLIPSIAFPMVFLLAFAGGLSNVGNVPGFDFPSGYTAFQYVFVFLQSAAFGGVFMGFAIAADFESGFVRRLLLASPRRIGLLLGFAIAALGRYAVTATMITLAALAAGMQVDGSATNLVGLVVLGVLVNITAAMFGAGLCLRAQTIQIAPAMQIPVFVTLFLAPVYVPLHLLDGWIHALSSWNPATALLEAGRGYLAGVPDHGALAFACGAGLVAITVLYAVRGLRRVERGE